MRRLAQLAQLALPKKPVTFSWPIRRMSSVTTPLENYYRVRLGKLKYGSPLGPTDLLDTPLQNRWPQSLTASERHDLVAWHCRKLIDLKAGTHDVFDAFAHAIEKGAQMEWQDLGLIPPDKAPFELHQSKHTSTQPADDHTRKTLVAALREIAENMMRKSLAYRP